VARIGRRFSYTYSHAFDEVSNGGVANTPFSVITSIGVQVDPRNLRANYGPAIMTFGTN